MSVRYTNPTSEPLEIGDHILLPGQSVEFPHPMKLFESAIKVLDVSFSNSDEKNGGNNGGGEEKPEGAILHFYFGEDHMEDWFPKGTNIMGIPVEYADPHFSNNRFYDPQFSQPVTPKDEVGTEELNIFFEPVVDSSSDEEHSEYTLTWVHGETGDVLSSYEVPDSFSVDYIPEDFQADFEQALYLDKNFEQEVEFGTVLDGDTVFYLKPLAAE